MLSVTQMSYKISEEGNISTVFLNGEIDMDVTEKAKEVILPLVETGKRGPPKFKRCFIHGLFRNISFN